VSLLGLTLAAVLAQSTCTPATPTRPVPTVRISGDSLTLNTCVGGGTAPFTTLDGTVDGNASGGWLFRNAGVSGTTATQIATAYTTDEATWCWGERCAFLVLEGGVNSIRTGTTPSSVAAAMAAVVDDALSKGYRVLWLDVTPYAGWASAGASPVQRATDYNDAWAAACAARASNPRLRCLANHAAFVDPANPGFLLPAYSCDGIHYSQAGMNLLASRVGAELLLLRDVP